MEQLGSCYAESMALKRRGYVVIAVLAWAHAGVVVACNTGTSDGGSGGTHSGGGTNEDGPPTGGADTGGTASGGAPTGSGGAQTSSGGAQTNFGGAGGGDCPSFDPGHGACGVCEETIGEHCSTDPDCSLPDDPECEIEQTIIVLYRGCGYVMQSSIGSLGDASSRIWSEDSEELVYYMWTPNPSAVCEPDRIAGVEPECDTWEPACEYYAGLGGQSGDVP